MGLRLHDRLSAGPGAGGVKFESWADLWKPELKGKIAAPDFDPSHIIVVAAMLSGGDAATWEKGDAKLKALKPNFKAFYANDANSQQLLANGETPVQVMLSMNAYYMTSRRACRRSRFRKKVRCSAIDTVGIMKGSKKVDLAYKFIDAVLDPEMQAEIANFKKGSPAVTNAKLDPEVAKLPGVFTHGGAMEQRSLSIDPQASRAKKPPSGESGSPKTS